MSEIRDFFIKTLDESSSGIGAMMERLMQLLRRRDDRLYGHLKQLQVEPQYYSFRWIMLLLSQDFPLPGNLFSSCCCSNRPNSGRHLLEYACPPGLPSSTINFMKAIKRWFDIHNTTYSGNDYKLPISKQDDSRMLWLENEFSGYIKRIQDSSVAAGVGNFTDETYTALLFTTKRKSRHSCLTHIVKEKALPSKDMGIRDENIEEAAVSIPEDVIEELEALREPPRKPPNSVAYSGLVSRPNGDRVAATQSNIASAEAPQGPVSTPRYRSVALPTLQVPTGAAKRAIEGIRLADNNYDIAVKTLKERFGRQELVNEHIDQLLALSPVRSSKEVDALEGLGVPPDQYTVVLNRVLMRCLPEDLAILYRQKKKEESTQDGDASAEHTTPEARTHKATDILSFLKIQVEVREEGKQAAPSSHPCHSTMVHDDMNSPTRSAHAIPSASALVATESLQQRTLSCVLCNSRAHSLAECTADMSVEEKKARLRNSRCCYRCGTRNHVAQFCRVSRNLTCNKCRRRHLTVLCELSRAVAMTASPRTTEQLVRSGTTPPTVTTASTGEKGAKSVLLQTVLELLCARKHDAADLFDPETWHPDDISILIGSDACWKVATGSIDRLNEELTAVETSFGWTVQGTSSPHEATTTSALLMSAGVECDESAMWRLDTIDVLRIWDSLFADPQRFTFLIYLCYAMLSKLRDKLMMGDFPSNIKLLQNFPDMDVSELISQALSAQQEDLMLSFS
ncbi:hypothetical protein HPB52_018115 [Rhipicephalus sanguineus]|uniref:Rab-GAP TBC domain-containing protein n=1 Tax=Rhipicephalus sanguineus TaxID=34632 RepID=A0A9D4YQN5_RHISA|nr:hypothetical protein HPB52_018115 [Rhipicephalus sanguineus]